MKKILFTAGLLIAFISVPLSSWTAQNQTQEEKEHDHDHGPDESEEDRSGHEGEGKEISSNVGPDKGILEASEQKGLKLSPEALRNFEVKTLKLEAAAPWKLPQSVRVETGEEHNIFRYRDGFFKRIDFVFIKKDSEQIIVKSDDLRPGDEVVVAGAAFLRLAEITAFGGELQGHSH